MRKSIERGGAKIFYKAQLKTLSEIDCLFSRACFSVYKNCNVTFLENTLLPQVRFVGPNFVPCDNGHLVSRDFPLNPWAHSHQDKCVQKVRLNASWTEARIVGFQKYDAHYIVANVSFSLELREQTKDFRLNFRDTLLPKIVPLSSER